MMSPGDFVNIVSTPYAFGMLIEVSGLDNNWWVVLTDEGHEIIWPESQLNLVE